MQVTHMLDMHMYVSGLQVKYEIVASKRRWAGKMLHRQMWTE